ncbi:hypothetical protein EYB45_08465 [Erythrobacteraceae bacterium CFH 75059]|uniref:hypothetical protein n=1 Tax=Qipengyuania thermophila TaxID=2509361 RepID=UPI0010209653|nr:hypothetical protein [Qipengyuania thermophila]TCD04271.1 hypothetical protein EYB45_08465 [Erythrobacteraceae bacterium CFH 75059]
MSLKPNMNIKPGRTVRVGTKMMKSGNDGNVSTPSIPQYAAELEELSENARKVARGEAEASQVEQSAPVPSLDGEDAQSKTANRKKS